VKQKGEEIQIQYETKRQVGEDEEVTLTTLTSKDKPRPEFDQALHRLIPHVIDICELPKPYKQGMEISGVSYSYGGDDETMGATITALKTLAATNAPLVLNTPHKPSAPYSEGADKSNCLTGEAVEHLEGVIIEAEKFINGDRAQGELGLEQ